jgi:hypothetical protein
LQVKCGGEQPVCKRCAARSDDCVYRLNPTLSYTQRLEERIKELEDQLAATNRSPGSAASAPSAADSVRSTPSGANLSDSSLRARSHPEEQQHHHQQLPPPPTSSTLPFTGLKLDEQGGITYHGATSFFHVPNDRGGPGNEASAAAGMDGQRRARLVTNAWHQRTMENLSDIPVRGDPVS